MEKVRETHQFHDGFEDGLEPVKAVDLNRVNSMSELLLAYKDASFGARRLGEAYEVLKAMVEDPQCFVVCTVSGAMTVAKMGLVLCEMIERGYVDLIITTGALQAHGMIEGSGMHHFKYRKGMDDLELFDKGYDRVYDTLELEKNLNDLELIVREVFAGMSADQPMGSRQVCAALGKHLHERFPHQRGILKSAYEHNVPIIIPAFTDSELGLDFAVQNKARRRDKRPLLQFDAFDDLEYYAERMRVQERAGIFTIGGGVPRNWAQQVGPYLEISHIRLQDDNDTTQRFRYGVRICPESEHFGGLSGCTYSEGMSWGKFVPPEEGGRFAEVLTDATIAWPILVKALMETAPRKATKP